MKKRCNKWCPECSRQPAKGYKSRPYDAREKAAAAVKSACARKPLQRSGYVVLLGVTPKYDYPEDLDLFYACDTYVEYTVATAKETLYKLIDIVHDGVHYRIGVPEAKK